MKTSITLIIILVGIVGYGQKDTLLFKHQDIRIYKQSATFKGQELYNAARDLTQLIAEEETNDCKVDYLFYYNPLSLVDTYYSYEAGEGGVIACGVSGSSIRIQTIDLRTNTAVSLSDLFSETDILKALKEDLWLKKNTEKSTVDLQSIHTFETFIQTINTLGDVTFNPASFAILGYDTKNKKVAVRFVGKEYMGFNHYQYVQLGLLLTPKQSFKKVLKSNTTYG